MVRTPKEIFNEGCLLGVLSTMEVAVTLKLIAKKELARVIVDSTVKEKAIALPADSKLLETTRAKVVEPIIGHLKADHRMDRCHPKGSEGDALHAALCAAGYNIRWLRMIAKKGQGLLLCLLQASGLAALIAKLAEFVGRNRVQSLGRRWALA